MARPLERGKPPTRFSLQAFVQKDVPKRQLSIAFATPLTRSPKSIPSLRDATPIELPPVGQDVAVTSRPAMPRRKHPRQAMLFQAARKPCSTPFCAATAPAFYTPCGLVSLRARSIAQYRRWDDGQVTSACLSTPSPQPILFNTCRSGCSAGLGNIV